jgi:hypothetical protein
VVADGVILALVNVVSGNNAAGENPVIVGCVFVLLWLRWACWFSGRTERIGLIKSVGLKAHYAEGAAFLGLAIGAAVPATIRYLKPGASAGPALELVLFTDIALFLLAAVLDHAVATDLQRPRPSAPGNTPQKESDPTLSEHAYPWVRVLTMLVCLTLTTQMVLFAYNGAIGTFKVAMPGELGWELLVPAAYGGAAFASLVGGLAMAKLRLPGDLLKPIVGRPCLQFGNSVEVPVLWVCLAGATCSLGAVWLSPRSFGPACLVAIALTANTFLSNSAWESLGTRFDSTELVKKVVALYFPLAILGFVVLSLSATYLNRDFSSAQWFLTSVGVTGLFTAVACARYARVETEAPPLGTTRRLEKEEAVAIR